MKYHKYEAYPSARFWVWHHRGWVKLTLKVRPSCEKCGGWMNERISSRAPTLSVCIQCEHKQVVAFRDSLSFGFGGPTDEGYSYERSTLIYEKGDKRPPRIIDEWENGGRDCDGSIRRSGSLVCPLDRLQSVPVPDYDFKHPTRDYFNGTPILRPDWQKQGRERVYDQFAQAAGY